MAKDAKRKSSPKASQPKAIAMPSSQNESISVRKIDNGFIVRHSSSGKDGSYKEREMFTPKKPNLDVAKMAKGKA